MFQSRSGLGVYSAEAGVESESKISDSFTLGLCQIQCVSDNAVREFRNPWGNYKNVGLMEWATTQDTRQKTMVNKTDYKEVTVCQNDL